MERWEEEQFKKGHYRTFRKKDSMYILHFIHFANKDLWMIINENAFDTPIPEIAYMNAGEVLSVYGIKL